MLQIWKAPIARNSMKKAETPLIIFMPEINPSHMGGTMRLGSRQTLFHQYDNEPSIAETIYNNEVGVFERHRHRYEVNPEMVPSWKMLDLIYRRR